MHINSRQVNVGQMDVRLNGIPQEEVDCFKYLGHKWHRMKHVKLMWYTE